MYNWNNITSNKILGSGGTSSVYFYEDPTYTKKYAAKVFYQNCSKYFERELLILKHIGFHRNIVSLEDNIEKNNLKILLLPYYEGKDLHEKINNGEFLNISEISLAMQQVFSALDYLIYKRVIHRDIKPSNIVYLNSSVDFSKIKIVDFTLSYIYNDKDLRLSFSGTKGMLAPEVIEQTRQCYDIDMWGAGIVLYYLITHQYPFIDSNDEYTERKILSCEYNTSIEVYKSAPSIFKQLIESLLVKTLPRPTPAYCGRMLRNSI